MNYRMISYILGFVLKIEAGLMSLSLIVALYIQNPALFPLL